MSKTVSLVIITRNMGKHVVDLLQSVCEGGTYERVLQILIVDDQSTDDSLAQIRRWKGVNDPRQVIEILGLTKNVGRFRARLTGAMASKATHTLFLDSRLKLQSDFAQNMFEALNERDGLIPDLFVDGQKSLYNLYWQRTHDRIFGGKLERARAGQAITHENISQHIIGGVLLCKTEHFIKACEPWKDVDLISDDTALAFELTKYTSLFREPKMLTEWEPRQQLGPFLSYIFTHRGATFADHHVYRTWSKLTYVFFAGVLSLLSILALLFFSPVLGTVAFVAALASVYISTAWFSNSKSEFLRLAPLHVAVIVCYGLGALFASINQKRPRI